MTTLAEQLNDVASAGSYTMTCGVDELRAATQEAGFVLFEADFKGVKGKQNVLNAFSQTFGFPPEVEANWDALAVGLCDLSWRGEAAGFALLLRNVSDTFGLSAHDREIAQDILDDTVIYWRQRNKAFWIFYI